MLATGLASPPNILPLGDSITYGVPIAGGYRHALHERLGMEGYIFQFIGTQDDNPSPALIAAGQAAHEGHNGYRVAQIAANLTADDGIPDSNGGFWLQRLPVPDIILLQIGANDILQNYQTSTLAQRLDELVNQIFLARPGAHLLIASALPIRITGKNALVQNYNGQIRDVIVPAHHGLGRSVAFVDQFANFVHPNGEIIAERLPDGIHPDQIGYTAMAIAWAAAIRSLPLTFPQWRAQYFTAEQLLDESVSGAAADYDRDGIPNVVEFFHNLHPTAGWLANDNEALTTTGFEVSQQARYLTLTFRHNARAAGATSALQLSSTLEPGSWQTIASDVTEHLAPDAITGDPRIRLKVNVTNLPRAFIRLSVTIPP